ncbi:hypothetical protein BRARA_C04328 [Brassica rapa]|uniref:EF-hand domain-containing protein n=1 Tax=Brassica campestris TaxID=3711 RepID=A0A398A673_BRACM|nr:hypothetical protein BRARA_C04328 [Brassica rapa]
MATPQDKLSSKSFKWFSTKALKLNLSFHNRRGPSPKSNSSSSLNSPRSNTDDNNNTESHHSHDELRRVFNHFDVNSDGFEDFVGLMTRRDLDGNGDGGGELKTAFEMFEVEKGSGCITPKGLQNMLTKLGESRTYGECEAMINYYDIDGNGVLDYHEFRQMMTV